MYVRFKTHWHNTKHIYKHLQVPVDEKIDSNQEVADTVMDSLGNEIKVKKEKILTAREKKKLEKKRVKFLKSQLATHFTIII